MTPDLPLFGIFGPHESGKTTLIEHLLPRLRARGLAVAVAKVHGARLEVDRPGKDSDRLYRAGADVLMAGRAAAPPASAGPAASSGSPAEGPPAPAGSVAERHVPAGPPAEGPPAPGGPGEVALQAEVFLRLRGGEAGDLRGRLADLVRRYDVVLVEGRKRVACDKVWLLGEGESAPPPEAAPVLAVLPRGPGRADAAWAVLEPWLEARWRRTPVYGGVLIGGRSRRMGRPKHLLRGADGRTWVERTAALVGGAAERVVLLGGGEVPASLAGLARLPDAPGLEGPLAGLVAAMRWAPWASWLVAACDLPRLSGEALAWLRATRRPGVWATLPRPSGGDGVEPLLAHYDFRAAGLLEALAAEGRLAPSLLAGHAKVITPAPPDALAEAWTNVNTPASLGAGGENT